MNKAVKDVHHKSRLIDVFTGKLSGASKGAARSVGIEAFRRTDKDEKYFELAALLLDYADFPAAQTYVNENDRDKRCESQIAANVKVATLRRLKGYAAFRAADRVAQPDRNGCVGPELEYYRIAGYSGVQRSFLAVGYILRYYCQNENPPEGVWAITLQEKQYFKYAANCVEEKLNQKPYPYEQEACDVAAAELQATEEGEKGRYTENGGQGGATVFGLIGLIGFAILVNANDSGGGNAPFDHKIQGPSELEE